MATDTPASPSLPAITSPGAPAPITTTSNSRSSTSTSRRSRQSAPRRAVIAQRHTLGLVPSRNYSLSTSSPEIEAAFTELRRQLKVPTEFQANVLAEAKQAAASPRLPDVDETATPFVTLDPAESLDLDQAFFIERVGDGYRVQYAIADVSAFVEPGGPMDVE